MITRKNVFYDDDDNLELVYTQRLSRRTKYH